MDTHLWKHYLSTISFADGNNELLLSDSNLQDPFTPAITLTISIAIVGTLVLKMGIVPSDFCTLFRDFYFVPTIVIAMVQLIAC